MFSNHMFDFYDQITASRQYPSLEQTNRQARGIGNIISFWNRLRSICPKGVVYNGPILNSQGEQCSTSHMLDEAMLDTRKFWFVEPTDPFRDGVLSSTSIRQAHHGPLLNLRRNRISSTLCLVLKIQRLAQMEYRTLHGDYP